MSTPRYYYVILTKKGHTPLADTIEEEIMGKASVRVYATTPSEAGRRVLKVLGGYTNRILRWIVYSKSRGGAQLDIDTARGESELKDWARSPAHLNPKRPQKKFVVIVTHGTMRPRGGIRAPFTRTFTVYAHSAKAAVKAVRDTGIPADKVEVISPNPQMDRLIKRIVADMDMPLGEPTIADRKRWSKMPDPFANVTEEMRDRAWRKGFVI